MKVTLNFDNSASASYQMVKGAESGFMIQAEGDRQIESVTADDKPLSPQNGIYTVSALNDDTDVAVTLVPLPEPEIPEPVVPDYYDVTLLILNGEQDGEPTYTVAQTMAVEEGKAVSFSVEPADEMWKVGEVMNATEQGGKWITAPLDGNLEVTVTFSLASPLAFDFETAVNGVVDGCEYQVYSDGDGVRIENVKGGDRIRVYTVGGAIMGDLTVGGNMDSALIHLAPGTYIIAINSTTIKFLHK